MQRPDPLPALAARHHASGLNSHFSGAALTFPEYIVQQRGMLARAHAARPAAERERRIEGNAPFELHPAPGFAAGRDKPYKRGILLVHGLSDSPYFMRHLARFFQQRGLRVMAVLLPGHGTQPGDLLDVSWWEWDRAMSFGVERLAAEVDEVYLGGLSAGGALSIRHALLDQRVRGLFLFAPALRISPRAAWARLHTFYSWALPREKWVSIMPDADLYKYESFPKNAAAQMYALTQELAAHLTRQRLDIPVFTAASSDDATVEVAAIPDFVMGLPHPLSRLLLYTTDGGKHMLGFPEERLELVDSAVPERRILSSAHTAIVLPPDDAHYGENGDYCNCLHYYPGDMEKYAACMGRTDEVLLGEITPENLRAGILRRLMYNPHFAALEASMTRFLDELV